MTTGWECPKCGRCYAPWVAECIACAPRSVVTTVVIQQPWIPIPHYMPLWSQGTILFGHEV